jgi:hypothetical protein
MFFLENFAMISRVAVSATFVISAQDVPGKGGQAGGIL